MTQKRIIRISKAKPDSGSISTRSYAFVFSSDLNDWIDGSTNVAKQRARDRAKANGYKES